MTEKILAYVRRKHPVKPRDIQQFLKGRLRSKEIKDILSQLVEAGEVEWQGDEYQPTASSPCCIFASRTDSPPEAFLQHGGFGKRLDFWVNRDESEFFNNIIYIYNIDRYMCTVYYPLAGKPSEGARRSPTSPGRGHDPRRTPLEQKLGTFIRMLASERDGEVVAAARPSCAR